MTFTELFQHAFSMPTTVFSVLMVLVSFYWVVSVLGLFHLDHATDSLASGAESLGHGADSLAHGAEALSAKAEMLGHGAESLGHSAESLGHGAEALGHSAESLGHSAESLGGHGSLGHEPHGGCEGHSHGAGDGRVGFFHYFAFGEVPRSTVGSLIVFFGWTSSMLGSVYVPGYRQLAMGGLVFVAALGFGSLILGFVAAAVAVQPLRKLLEAGSGQERGDLVGKLCRVKTGRVDEDFGQAELEDGSAVVQVRTRSHQEHDLKNGSKALIYEYDPAREIFFVTHYEETSTA